MCKDYLTDRQWSQVCNLKMKGARFEFEDLNNGKFMMIAVLDGRRIKLIAVNGKDLYAFKKDLNN